MRINLKGRLPGVPGDAIPVEWAEDYGSMVMVAAGVISDHPVSLYYDDYEWVCHASEESGGWACGPGCSFRDEAQSRKHLDCEFVAYCKPPNDILLGREFELSFNYLTPASNELSRRVSATFGPCVYLVQMHPLSAPNEIKAGFSKNLVARLKAYRTGSPHSQLIAVRPGSLADEAELLRRLSRIGSQLSAEVFDVNSVDGALRVFEALPAPEVAS